MKKNYLTSFLLIATFVINAQNYEYSLSFLGNNPSNGNYQIALVATPDFDQSTPAPTADMGAALYIPSGYTIGNFVAGNSGLQFFEWANSQENSYDGGVTDLVQLLRTDIMANNFTHTIGQTIELVLFDIISDSGNGNNPTSGEIILAENIDQNVIDNFYESYTNINLQDGNGTQDYFSNHNPTTNSINFATLSVPNNLISQGDTKISVYPNPIQDFLNITTSSKSVHYELYNILGQTVKINGTITDNNTITISLSHLSNGLYLLKTEDEDKTLKSFRILKNE